MDEGRKGSRGRERERERREGLVIHARRILIFEFNEADRSCLLIVSPRWVHRTYIKKRKKERRNREGAEGSNCCISGNAFI